MSNVVEHQQNSSVALVVLNYNYARFLAQAIDSALAQSLPYDQVIVVDDGSTDHSRLVLSRYRNKVELIYKENGGQLSAALHALDSIRCAYVHYLDSDDFVVPNARAQIAHELQQCVQPPTKLQFRLRCVNDAGSLDSVVPAYPEHYDAEAQLRDAQLLGASICPPTSGNVFRVETLRALPREVLDQRDYIDGTANLAMPYCGTVRTVNSVIANYRMHGGNVSRTHAPTVDVLRHECARVRRRWQELTEIFPDLTPPRTGTTLLELEARNMIAALDGRRHVGLSIAYARRLVESGMPTRQKLILAPWMLMLAFVPRALKPPMIRARRSAVNRSKFTRKLVSLCLGNRRHSQSEARPVQPAAWPYAGLPDS